MRLSYPALAPPNTTLPWCDLIGPAWSMHFLSDGSRGPDPGVHSSAYGPSARTSLAEAAMTHRYVLPFPVAPGKTDADAASIAEYLKANMDEYRESRKRLGTTMERAYLQPTPMGSFVISYAETALGFADWMQGLVTSDLEIDRRFIAMVAEIHGVDVRQPPAGPPPETLGEWVDPDVTPRRKGLAFIAPVLPGMDDAGRAFAKEAFVTRRAEFIDSRRALGQNAEVVTLSVTPMGSILCGYLEGDDPVDGNERFAASTRPYDVWFKEQLAGLFPPAIDFNQPLPPIVQLFDYVAELAPV